MGLPSGMVTLLFTDIEDSIGLWEADPEAMTEASGRHNRMVREQVEAAGGHVVKTMGETFRAVFADPLAALAAAVAIQRAVGAEPWPPGLPIRVQMALHSGACLRRDGDYVGPVVNRADRLLAIGHGGQVLATAATYELLADRLPGGIGWRDLGEHRLQDLGRAERVFQVTGPGLAGEFGPLRSLDDPGPRHNLPSQATSFVGRAAELAELRSLAGGGSRLVTIAGPGGIGKSRLALQVAAGALAGGGDGVWLVELAPVAEPELVARTVAAVLGVREEPGRPVLDTLVDAVGDRSLLVVLDNAEHVLGAAAKLADALMRCCPRACLLVTSREPLGVSGERVFRVPPLAVPPADLAVPPAGLAAFESVQLFADRAAMHRQGFVLDESNAAAVAGICVRLDGIPLALELAAARLGSLSAAEISARLDQRFGLLTGGSRTALPRHQTLRALIDWSYDLLIPAEQRVLARLSVFAGSWTLAGAEAVAGGGAGDWQVLDHLAALVDKSLVLADEIGGSTRYLLLETVRHYAAERLARRPGPELDETRVAHRDYYLALAETAGTHLRGPDEAVWLDRLEAEFDNIRAALALSLADPDGTEPGPDGTEPGPDGAEPGLRLATELRWFCNMRGHGAEILEVLNALLERPDAQRSTLTRARALTAACHLRNQFGDDSAVPAMAGEAMAIARDHADDAIAADAVAQLCWFRFEHGDLPGALARIDEAARLARTTGDPRLITYVLLHRAVFAGEGNDVHAAFADLQEACTFARAAGDNYQLAIALGNLGRYEHIAGQLQAARAHLQEANTLADSFSYPSLYVAFRQMMGFADLLDADPGQARHHFIGSLDATRITGVKSYVHGVLLGLALAAGADGDPTVAATMHGVADEQYEQAGRVFEAMEGGLRERDHARLRAALGDAAFEAAYRRGRTLSRADGIALATAPAEPDPGAASAVPAAGQALADGSAGLLSEREREIVALVAGGATDAQIAARLFLSVNTVRSHLDRIRDKAGARRRADLVRYAMQAGIEAVALSS